MPAADWRQQQVLRTLGRGAIHEAVRKLAAAGKVQAVGKRPSATVRLVDVPQCSK